ncbi:hypothetical protein HDV00_001725 [Rhizophlyctis rosea]|nr:hypothetical protein HDV00_001725 [Rhizophlyctis rosea]
MLLKSLCLAVLVATASAADSFCDKYTTALFTNNTGENQLKLMTVVVNTVVIGNWSATPTDKNVPGILADFTANGKTYNLLKYFSGAGLTTNQGGNPAMVNFLDGGGADPLKIPQAANSNATSSNQFNLLNHLYQGFGALLGCTGSGFPSYQGRLSMYETHKFMNISKAENDYFISQVALAASAYGVTDADLAPVGSLLNTAFNNNCNTTSPLVPGSDLAPARQGFCLGEGCTCDATNSTTKTPATTSAPSPTSTTTASGAAPARIGVSVFLVIAGSMLFVA